MNKTRVSLAAMFFALFAVSSAFGQATIFRIDPDVWMKSGTKEPATFRVPGTGVWSGGGGGGTTAVARMPRRSGSAFDPNWHIEVTPYIWMPKIEGNLRVNNTLVRVDSSASTLAGSLDFILGTRFEARKAKIGFFVDEDYVNLATTGTLRGPLATPYDVQPTLNIFEIGPAYTLFAVPNSDKDLPDVFSVDVLGGLRWTHFGLGLTAGNSTAEGSRNIIDGFVGNRLKWRPHPKFLVGGGYTIGGGGSHPAWTADFNGDYQFHRHMSVSGGYRVLDMNADDSNNAVGFDGRLRGLIFGFTYHR